MDRAARKVSRTPGANADGIGYTRSNGIIRAGTILDRPLPFPFRRCITGYSAWPLLLAMQRMRRLPIERKAAHDASGLVTPPTLLSASIGQVDDHARFDTVDRDVRFIDKASANGSVGPGGARRLSLLDHDPVCVVGHDKAVEIKVEPVLDRRAVNLATSLLLLASAACRGRSGHRFQLAHAASGGGDCRARRKTRMPSSPDKGVRPRFSAPMTLVMMPEECQSIPITAPDDWNQNGCANAATRRDHTRGRSPR